MISRSDLRAVEHLIVSRASPGGCDEKVKVCKMRCTNFGLEVKVPRLVV